MSSSSDHQNQPRPLSTPTPSPSAAARNCTPEVIDTEEEEPAAAASSSVKGYVSDEIEFRTPTSRDHRIPRSRSCPPAPRKPKPKSMAHKRKLTFEDAAREEVDGFFETATLNAAKRRGPGRANTTMSNSNKSIGGGGL